MKDGRGKHQTKKKKRNIESIKEWFRRNPNSTQKECCDALGLSRVTVWKHVKEICRG